MPTGHQGRKTCSNRVLLFGMCIGICHSRKLRQVWGSTAPLPEVVRKLCCRKAPLWTFDYHMEKSESLWCNPWAVGWSLEGTFYGFCMGKIRVLHEENRPKSENWATLKPCSSATVRRTEKLTDIGNSLALGLQCGINSISLQCIPALSEVPVWPPQSLGFWGQMTPEWKLVINFCPNSAFHPRFTCNGENRLLRSCRKVVSYCWQKKTCVRDTL